MDKLIMRSLLVIIQHLLIIDSRGYPMRFGTPPDVEELEKVRDELLDALEK